MHRFTLMTPINGMCDYIFFIECICSICCVKGSYKDRTVITDQEDVDQQTGVIWNYAVLNMSAVVLIIIAVGGNAAP